ncbi:DNA-binding transcriptional LysR family regulator [Variovorax boronicumulans]|uniref:LysR family transcriptional regulator n=1 Tax=Variovorax boronicumulans TaxID=436515 RepID=UPI002786FB0B|nr:LysR family transcriptional regulator [Variovorax boronicumulans]MDP9912268.1 DNA-binding transcriptional LysR family regulator [Variovorax boronicumulans]
MNITIRELRGFRAVYELRNFSSAAKALHMSQSAVSKLCQEMEAKVGNPLFERSTRKVDPTIWADHLYGYACEILGIIDAAQRSLDGLARLDIGEVHVAGSPMMMHGLLTQPVRHFHAKHPGVRIGLHELSTDDVITAVIDGKADFGIVSLGAAHPKLNVEILYQETLHAVYAAGHPLVQNGPPTWEDLSHHPHISLHPSFSVRRTVDRVYREHELGARSMIEVGSVLSVLSLVKSGLGVAVLPSYTLGFVEELGLVSFAMPKADYAHPISLIRRWNMRSSLAADVLVGMLREFVAIR